MLVVQEQAVCGGLIPMGSDFWRRAASRVPIERRPARAIPAGGLALVNKSSFFQFRPRGLKGYAQHLSTSSRRHDTPAPRYPPTDISGKARFPRGKAGRLKG